MNSLLWFLGNFIGDIGASAVATLADKLHQNGRQTTLTIRLQENYNIGIEGARAFGTTLTQTSILTVSIHGALFRMIAILSMFADRFVSYAHQRKVAQLMGSEKSGAQRVETMWRSLSTNLVLQNREIQGKVLHTKPHALATTKNDAWLPLLFSNCNASWLFHLRCGLFTVRTHSRRAKLSLRRSVCGSHAQTTLPVHWTETPCEPKCNQRCALSTLFCGCIYWNQFWRT